MLTLLFPLEHHRARIESLALHDFLPLSNTRARFYSDTEVHSIFPYEQPLVKELIWALKYENSEYAARLCGEALAEDVFEMISDTLAYGNSPVLVIPIPLSPERKRQRGYNQTERVAAYIIPLLCGRGNLSTALIRIRETPVQTRLSRRERLRNLENAFALPDASVVEGQHCLLVDDVVTTGSTLAQAKRVLEAAGARSVICCAVAYAGHEK